MELSGAKVWGDESSGVLLDARQVLHFLARSWAYLSWEEGLPLGLPFASLRDVRDELDERRNRAPHALRREFERTFDNFMFGHDLAQMNLAAALPAVVVVKQGLYGWVLREDDAARYRLSELLDPLEALASTLAERLATVDDESAHAAVAAWTSRWNLTSHEAAEIVTGLSSDDVRLIAEESADFRQELAALADSPSNDPTRSELLAAARLSVGLPPNQIAHIVSLIGPIPDATTTELDRLSELAPASIAGHVFAYDQGLEAARWLRQTLGISPDERVEPERMLSDYGVIVRYVKVKSIRTVDAVAAWGPRRGPCVLINTFGTHAQSGAGRRATAAHEFCHLLLDRAGALPVAEVLRGQESTVVEARARAFAAEFLLPQQVAGDAYRQFPDNPKRVVKRLSYRFGVSAELVAWNIRNSGVPITEAGRQMLSRLVQQPWRF